MTKLSRINFTIGTKFSKTPITTDTSHTLLYVGNIDLSRLLDPKLSFPHKDKNDKTSDIAVLIARYDNCRL